MSRLSVLLMLLVLSVCSCASGRAKKVYYSGRVLPAASGGGGGGEDETATSAPATEAKAGGEAAPAQGEQARKSTDKIKRMVIQTADLTVVTTDPADGFYKAQRMAKEMGGYTLDSSRSEKRLRITLRVPGARFEEALRRLAKLGKVEHRGISGKDVTTEFVDLSMRLKNALKMRKRYLELLRRSQNVAEAVQVQKELERVTASIESLKGRLSVIRNQVSLSTIVLTLERPTRPGPIGWIFYGLYKGVVWLFVWN